MVHTVPWYPPSALSYGRQFSGSVVLSREALADVSNDVEEGSRNEVIFLGVTKCANLPGRVGFDEILERAITETASAHVVELVGFVHASTDLFLKVLPVAHGSN